MMFKIVNGLAPPYLMQMFTFNNTLNNYSLRSLTMRQMELDNNLVRFSLHRIFSTAQIKLIPVSVFILPWPPIYVVQTCV